MPARSEVGTPAKPYCSILPGVSKRDEGTLYSTPTNAKVVRNFLAVIIDGTRRLPVRRCAHCISLKAVALFKKKKKQVFNSFLKVN